MSSQSIQVIQHNFLPAATSPQVASKFWGPVLGWTVGEACVHFLCPVGKVPRAYMPLLSGNVWKWTPHLSGARYLLPFLLFLPHVVTVQAPCWGWVARASGISPFSPVALRNQLVCPWITSLIWGFSQDPALDPGTGKVKLWVRTLFNSLLTCQFGEPVWVVEG